MCLVDVFRSLTHVRWMGALSFKLRIVWGSLVGSQTIHGTAWNIYGCQGCFHVVFHLYITHCHESSPLRLVWGLTTRDTPFFTPRTPGRRGSRGRGRPGRSLGAGDSCLAGALGDECRSLDKSNTRPPVPGVVNGYPESPLRSYN